MIAKSQNTFGTLKNHILQNHWANFNQAWHKESMGEHNSSRRHPSPGEVMTFVQAACNIIVLLDFVYVSAEWCGLYASKCCFNLEVLQQ